MVAFFKKHFFIFLLFLLTPLTFYPVFLKGQIPLSANLLVSFYNPWAQEKFSGWEQGIFNKPVGIDDLRIFYPQRLLTTQTFEKLQLPLWNPYAYSGNYQMGLSETAVFYPLTLIFLLLPQLIGWIVLIMAEPLLAGIGMYFFLETLLQEKRSAFFGALAFGFSGVMLVRMVEGLSVGHTLLWMPFAFWSIEAFFQKKQVRYLVFLLVSFSMSLFAGWFQFTFYIVLFAFFYAVLRILIAKEFTRFSLCIFLPFLFLPLITLPHLLAALQTFLVSPRGNFTKGLLELHLMPMAHAATLLFPDLWGNPGVYNYFGKSEYKESIIFIGVVPFLVSLFSLRLIKQNRIVLFFIVAIVISFLLATDNLFSHFFVGLPIPLVSSLLSSLNGS